MLTLSNIRYISLKNAPRMLSMTIGPRACLLIAGNNSEYRTRILLEIARLNNYKKEKINQRLIDLIPKKKLPTEIFYNKVNVDLFIDEWRDQVGYLPEHPNGICFQRMTLLDNLILWAKLYNVEPALDLIINMCGLDRYIDYIYRDLTVLIRRISCIAIGLIMPNPTIWLMDNPLGDVFLDNIRGTLSIAQIICYKCNQNGIVILTSTLTQLNKLTKFLNDNSVDPIIANMDNESPDIEFYEL
ncbi:P-loop NTPase family protein [Lyticum sinuosum]|uniref:ABC transporter ATP-binding protein n=1 Tax=Lyticum sinuosum TaxID=1332059 RepID=A0AAE4VKA1_9RICK|nr:hypothetical protein [Lyticum sinuosum]MDZ5761352.1 ABC transporter ATP-binding protein [Lyticum sinuosum]